jgi:predicted ester cyclase
MIARGDKVAYVLTMKGIQTGPMGDLPATGKEFTLVNIIIQRMEEGKVAETWVSWDNVAFLSQLGDFPPPASH